MFDLIFQQHNNSGRRSLAMELTGGLQEEAALAVLGDCDHLRDFAGVLVDRNDRVIIWLVVGCECRVLLFLELSTTPAALMGGQDFLLAGYGVSAW